MDVTPNEKSDDIPEFFQEKKEKLVKKGTKQKNIWFEKETNGNRTCQKD